MENQTEKIIEFLLVVVISGCLWVSILESRGNIKKNKGVVVGYFSGVGSGRVLGCFLSAFWMLFGCSLVAFWEPLGPGLLELLGSCGKDLGCFFVFVY